MNNTAIVIKRGKPTEKEIYEALQIMLDGARLVVERWSNGDLADAVNSLEADTVLVQELIDRMNS